MADIIRTYDFSAPLENKLAHLPREMGVENSSTLREFIREAQLGKTVMRKQKKKLGESVCYKYTTILARLAQFWGKPFRDVDVKDMERFIEALEKGTFRSGKSRAYSPESQRDFKKCIKKFFKWLHRAEFPDGNAAKFYELTYWIDSSIQRKEVTALSREQIAKLAAGSSRLRDQVAIWVLFDSGARAQEFLNIKVSDLERADTYYKLRLRHEFSKTLGRTVSISMAECVALLDLWLKQHPSRKGENISPDALLVPISYAMLRKRLSVLGERVLQQNITAHMLRHSSATYYANKLSQYQLCYRYGWSMGSAMPQRYIDRSGVQEEQTAKLEKADQLREVRTENQQVKEDMVLMKEQNLQLAKRLKELQDVVTHITENPKILDGIRSRAR